MKKPLVSVVIITYGHENYIKQAIEGALMQECNFEVELIVANDCSPDNTNSVVNQIIQDHPRSNRIKYTEHKENKGATANLIWAIQQSKGKYCAICEGDDYWTDIFKLQKQVDFLEANEDYSLSFHKVDILTPEGKILDDFITKVPENYETLDSLVRLGNYIHTPSVVFRNVIKNFPPEFSISPIGDYFLYILLAEQGKLKYIEEKMGIYRYGVGFFSGLDLINKNKKWQKTLLLIMASTNNEFVKKVLLRKLFENVKLDFIIKRLLVRIIKKLIPFFPSSHIYNYLKKIYYRKRYK